MVEPIAVLLGGASIGIYCDICGILTFRTHMKFFVVTLSVEVIRRDMVLLNGILDVEPICRCLIQVLGRHSPEESLL